MRVWLLSLNILSVRFILVTTIFSCQLFFKVIFQLLNWSIVPRWTFKLVPDFLVIPSTLMSSLVISSLYPSLIICRPVIDLAGSVRSLKGVGQPIVCKIWNEFSIFPSLTLNHLKGRMLRK